jgi:uncharacterized membrane protein
MTASLILHLAAILLFVVGLYLTLRQWPGLQTSSTPIADRLISFGPLFFAVPYAVFGMQHFSESSVVIQAVPPWLPAHHFWLYLVGIANIAAALSLITGKLERLAAPLLGLMMFLFVALIYIPDVFQEPRNRFVIALFFRDGSLCAGALALAATLNADTRELLARRIALAARIFFAVAMIFYGVEHFLHPHFAPGVPLELEMPAWFPAQAALAWITGALLVACGVGLFFNSRARNAAVVLGVLYCVLTLIVYLPMEILHPSIAISGTLDYVADTLSFSGAAFFIAASTSGIRASVVLKEQVPRGRVSGHDFSRAETTAK